MAFVADPNGEGHVQVADAAVFAPHDLKHGILHRALLGTGEDLGMADFAAIPYGMFLVRENDIGRPGRYLYGKIFPGFEGIPVKGDARQKIDELDQAIFFGLFPINGIAGIQAGELLSEFLKFVFPLPCRTPRMAPGAPFSFFFGNLLGA